ncbi:hypothetical protein HK405_008559 [Cladochytrium tenue]|nr:hypothetical protein HK405_008559 [Cladochytrium tenue]
MDLGRFAALGGVFIVGVETAMYPFNTLQTLLMSQRTGKARATKTLSLVIHLLRNEGLSRFWKGAGTAVMGMFPGQACYYLTYECAQEAQARSGTRQEPGGTAFWRGFVSGAAADVVAGLVYVPADVITQRLQTQSVRGPSFTHNRRNGLDVARHILAEEGAAGFWRGYVGYVASFAPASAVQWGIYETTKPHLQRLLRRHWHEREGGGSGSRTSDKPVAALAHSAPSTTVADALAAAASGAVAGAGAAIASNPMEVLRVRHQLLERRSRRDAEVLRGGYVQLAGRIWRAEGPRAFYRGLLPRLVLLTPGATAAMAGYETIKGWS